MAKTKPVVAETSTAAFDPMVDPAPVESLEAFLSRIQEAKQPDGLVVVEASHPDAVAGLYTGKYSGFVLSKGGPSVRWNDGSTE